MLSRTADNNADEDKYNANWWSTSYKKGKIFTEYKFPSNIDQRIWVDKSREAAKSWQKITSDIKDIKQQLVGGTISFGDAGAALAKLRDKSLQAHHCDSKHDLIFCLDLVDQVEFDLFSLY